MKESKEAMVFGYDNHDEPTAVAMSRHGSNMTVVGELVGPNAKAFVEAVSVLKTKNEQLLDLQKRMDDAWAELLDSERQRAEAWKQAAEKAHAVPQYPSFCQRGCMGERSDAIGTCGCGFLQADLAFEAARAFEQATVKESLMVQADGLLHDKVHKDIGNGRAARTVRGEIK